MRAHHRYEYAPARYPVARPEPAQRTAGALCLSTARTPALGMGCDCECSKDPFGSRSTPPHYYHSKRLSTTTPSGNSESDLPIDIDHTIKLPSTIRTLPHIVLPNSDPFLPTAAVLAREDY
eukprot:scaffold268_cov134-Isochrysis_galbana.AAC.1